MRFPNAWLGARSWVHWEGYGEGARPSPEKMNFSLEMMCFDELSAVFF